MSARDALNRELFHGTHASLEPDTVLYPTAEGYGTDEMHSFATTSPELAAKHGPNIYLVAPVDESDLAPDIHNDDDESGWEEEYTERPLNFSSRAGFRIVRPY